MGKSKAPKAPNPLPAAQATAAANKDVAQYTTALDRPTQVDPYGSTTWEWGTQKGTKSYQLNQSLSNYAALLRQAQAMPARNRTEQQRRDALIKSHTNSMNSVRSAITALQKTPNPGDWVQKTVLSPEQQRLYNLEMQAQTGAYNLGLSSMNAARSAGVGSQLSLSGLPSLNALSQPNLRAFSLPSYQKTGLGIPTMAGQSFAPQQMQGANVDLPQWQALSGEVPQAQQLGGQAPSWQALSGDVPTWAGMQGDIPQWQASQMGLPENYYSQFQNQLSGMQDIDTSSQQFQSQGDAVRDALYQQMTRFSDQRFTQEEEALRQRLLNQGFAVGSEGFNREMEAFRRSKDESYAGAQLQSVLAGGQEQSRLFADMLAGTQQNIGRRAQQSQLDLAQMGGMQDAAAQIYGLGLGERQSAFDAAMAGRGQQFAESQFGFGADMASREQMFGEQQYGFEADMASRQQQQQELLDYFNQQMAGRQQQFGEAQFGFDAGAQSYALDLQNRQAMQEGNLAAYQADLANRALMFDSGMSRYQADLTARQTNYANDMQRYQAELARSQQMFQNQAQAEQWDAAMRNQLLQERLTQRQIPLNEALAMAGMTGVQGPAYQPFNLSNPWQPVDYLGAQNMQYQNQINAANFSNAQQGQTFGLLGSLAMAGATAW